MFTSAGTGSLRSLMSCWIYEVMVRPARGMCRMQEPGHKRKVIKPMEDVSKN